ncbi:glycosyltransferase family 1 protein [Paenibacillus sp. H1-7]|uniref:glycosyltransferase family 4 protein n=1 Tax=Paenibacillus sp. H1-7 TaxID=2282849 RepID=UPI001EF8CCB2|nr:glycosyltransferase family 1 protein [Paenibacillus sp. H1-7]ULL18970.1 glycosyltransferase family 1 protein [Paenibacillus sp. H1-7]
MKVALFTDTFLPDVNGVAKTLGRWIHFLESKGAECKVFAPDGDSGNASSSKRVERFYSIPFLLYPECRMAIPNPIQLKKKLAAFSPDLIHVATPFNLGLVGLHYAKKNRVPLVASYHTHFDQYLSYYKLQWMEPMLWKYMLWFHQECQKIYVPSRSTMNHLQEKGLKNLEIWSRGVEAKQFQPVVDRTRIWQQYDISPGKFVILFVGRLAPEKSVDVLMDTFAALSEDVRASSHLVITGDGPLYKPLLEQCGAMLDVTFTGFKQGKDLADLYAAADVFLFPSSTETFGNVVLEAMASGTAVIGSAAGGVKDNIVHCETGMLCKPGDISEFVHAVELLYHNEEYRSNISMAGRQYSLQQSWEHIFNGLYESYLAVLHESGPMVRSCPAAADVKML